MVQVFWTKNHGSSFFSKTKKSWTTVLVFSLKRRKVEPGSKMFLEKLKSRTKIKYSLRKVEKLNRWIFSQKSWKVEPVQVFKFSVLDILLFALQKGLPKSLTFASSLNRLNTNPKGRLDTLLDSCIMAQKPTSWYYKPGNLLKYLFLYNFILMVGNKLLRLTQALNSWRRLILNLHFLYKKDFKNVFLVTIY